MTQDFDKKYDNEKKTIQDTDII